MTVSLGHGRGTVPGSRPVRTGELGLDRPAQLVQVAAQRVYALRPQPLLDRLGKGAEPRAGLLQQRLAVCAQADQVRALVLRVRDALDVPALSEPADAEEH